MSTDWKALCAELVTAWDSYSYADAGDATDRMTQYVTEAQAALAQPEPEGVSDEEIEGWHTRCADLTRLGKSDHYWAFDVQRDDVVGIVRAALARWGRPAIEPVPVSERLPGPEDCDAEGRCWFWERMDDRWVLMDRELAQQDWPWHWLPHYALPVPQQQEVE